MDYEKKYKEALVKAKSFELPEYKNIMLSIFPELTESKDEKIRKVIYGWICTQPSQFFDNGFSKEEMLAWLEKRGEQKPIDKIKPKFKVGDKVIGIVSDMQYYITDVCYDHYYTESGCIIMFCSQDNFKLVEQKPAWGEDENMIEYLIRYIDNTMKSSELKSKLLDWLKSLKQRIAP